MRIIRTLIISLLFTACCTGAELSVPNFFSDHMVLQHGEAVKIWGWSNPGREVTVQFRGSSGKAETGDDGKWHLRINSGEPDLEAHQLVIRSGEEQITIQDVLVGEVWFAAGQSNMVWKLRDSANPDKTIAAADHPQIRMFHSPEVTAEPPQDNIEGDWNICSPQTAGDYSAVAYYYARKLQQELGVPVGVIVSAWGGKRIQSFISREALDSRPETRKLINSLRNQEQAYDPVKALARYEEQNAAFKQWIAEGRPADKPRPRPMNAKPQRPLLTAGQPGVIFNSMVHPFIGYNMRGVIWYQGESDASTKLLPYDLKLTALIQDWRNRWGDDFPFYYVQLANFKKPTTEPGDNDGWPFVQNGMRKVLDSTLHTGMAVINDAGDQDDIHPKDKQTPGERLARWALAKTYQRDLIHSGPLFESVHSEGPALVVSFSSVGEGLKSRDGKPLQRFEIAASDGKWLWADAEITDPSQVKISHSKISNPVAARYAWAANPEGANLVNSEGLPTSVFCTPPPESKYPEFSWDHIPRYMHVYKQDAFTEEEIEFLAGYPLITFEKAQGTARGSVQEGTLQAARAVKKRNPKTKILYYKNIIIDWPGSAMSKELESIEGGYLQSKDGSFPLVNENSGSKFFDISLPEVQDWWMTDASRMLGEPSIDGIFIDANIKVLIKDYFARGRRVGEEKAQKLIEGYHRILGRINTNLRPDHIILANLIRARFEDGGLQYLQHFDGSYLEAFEHAVGGMSKVDYIGKGISHAQEAAQQGKVLAFTVGLGEALESDSSGIGLDEARKNIDTLESVDDRLNYLTAMFLVIAEKYSYFYPNDKYVVRANGKGEQINRTWMHTFPIFEKKLGPPKGPATKDGYIYTREFEHCSVWLDIENETGKLTWR